MAKGSATLELVVRLHGGEAFEFGSENENGKLRRIVELNDELQRERRSALQWLHIYGEERRNRQWGLAMGGR